MSRWYGILTSVFLLLSGCAAFETRGNIQSGREALLLGRCEQALGYFERAAKLDPHYVTDFTVFEEGVWTYVGRSHYRCGRLEDARKAFERARREEAEDHLAHIYLGLVMMRQGQSKAGIREASVGLRSLKKWLDFIDRYDFIGEYWDPDSALENEMDTLLAMIHGGEARWQAVAPRLEELGVEFEEEIDRVWEDFQQDQSDGDSDSQK